MKQETQSPGLAMLWAVLTPADRRNAILLLGLMILGMFFEMLGIGLVIPVIQLLSQPDVFGSNPVLTPLYEALGRPAHGTMVVAAVLGLVGVYICKTAFLGVLYWQEMRFAFGLQADVSQRLFNIYLRQPYTFHLQRNSAELIRNIVIEVAQLVANCMLPALLLIAESLILLGLFLLLLVIEPVGAMTSLLVLGSAAWILHRLTGRHLSRWGAMRQVHEALRLQRLQEGLGGAKDVILSGRENEFMHQYSIHNQRTAAVTQKQKTLQKLPQLWLELLAISGLAILILVMLSKGVSMAGMLPTLGLFAAAAFRMLPSANRIVGAIQSLRYGMPVIDVIHAELKLPVSPASSTSSYPLGFKHCIEFKDVSFTYPNAPEPAVRSICLKIEHGSSIGLIGSSGAGKSTLVDLFLGLLRPAEGAIEVDGIDIQHRLRDWQAQIGYVPQTIFLSDDSLRRNIAFGMSDGEIDDTVVWNVLRLAQLADFVATLPDGLDTMLGERGVRLSGGQRQRVGIARALYHGPSVLVLDEATSALDSDTEREVMEAVWALQGQKTILIVAHRLTTIAHCDRVYRLSGGGLAESGHANEAVRGNRMDGDMQNVLKAEHS